MKSDGAADLPNLIAFITARLDEDERTALAATRNTWVVESWTNNNGVEFLSVLADYDQGAPAFAIKSDADAAHITRHDPARVLRDVQGTRAILDAVSSWRHYSCQDGYYSCSQAAEENGFHSDEACADEDRVGEPCDCGLEARQLAILRPLALPYADHPDYRAEWAAG